MTKALKYLAAGLALLVAYGISISTRQLSRRPLAPLVAALQEAHASGALSLPLKILPGDVVLSLGDSFDEGSGNGPGVGTGWVAPAFQTMQAAVFSRHYGTVKATINTVYLAPAVSATFITDGRSGTGVADIATNFSTRVCAHNPTLILWHISQNDWFYWDSSNEAGWQASAKTAFDAIDACAPTARVAVISNFLGESEQWIATGNGWDQAVGNNPEVQGINGYARDFLALRDATRYIYIDLRGTPGSTNTVWAWESTHNTPAPGTTQGGGLMDSTFHPVKGFGQRQLSNMLLTFLDFSALN